MEFCTTNMLIRIVQVNPLTVRTRNQQCDLTESCQVLNVYIEIHYLVYSELPIQTIVLTLLIT